MTADPLSADVLAYYEDLAHGGKGIDVLKIRRSHLAALTAIARAALASTEAPERVPEGWRVEWRGVWHPTEGEDFTLTAGYYADRPYLVPADTPPEEGAPD